MRAAKQNISVRAVVAESYRRSHRGKVFMLAAHAHASAQIIVPLEGVAQIWVHGVGNYFLTRGQGIYIAPGHAHEGTLSGVLELDNLYITLDASTDDGLATSFVFNISELFLALWTTLLSKKAWTKNDGAVQAMLLLLKKEMKEAQEREAFLPMPKQSQLLPLVHQFAANPGAFVSIEDVAATLGISARHFRRLFRKECGLSFSQWLARARLMLAKELLFDHQPISEIALEVGFNEFASFSRFFKKATGLSPSEWAQRFVRR